MPRLIINCPSDEEINENVGTSHAFRHRPDGSQTVIFPFHCGGASLVSNKPYPLIISPLGNTVNALTSASHSRTTSLASLSSIIIFLFIPKIGQPSDDIVNA